MTKRKAASSGESAQGSKGKQVEGEASSKKGKLLSISSKEKALLKDEGAIVIYETHMSRREIEMGRKVDFEWLAKEDSIELDTWLHVVGWNHFMEVNEVVYPRLVRILYANLNPYTMTSWIGGTEIKLDVEQWCETFNIPNLTTEEEEPVRTLAREALFSNLYGKEGLGHKPWMSVAELPLDPTIRLAANVLMNIIVPKKGSKEQIKEEEARILYTMKEGADLNIAREIVERIKLTKFRKSTPLCYPMHLMVIMKKAGIKPSCAGDVDLKRLKPTSFIDDKTLNRLGFKKDFTTWNYIGKRYAKTKFTGESQTAAGEAEEEEEGQRQEEEEGGRESEGTAAAESSMPPPPSRPSPKGKGKVPSTSTPPPPSPQILSQLANLSNQLAHFSAHLTEKLDFFTATVNSRMDSLDSRLDSMDSKLEEVTLRVKNCEFHLSKLQATQPPSPQASQSQTQAPPKPPSSQPQPQSTQPKQPSSPLFSLEELIGIPTTQPEPIPSLTPTQSPKPQPDQPTQPTSQPSSESELATRVVRQTLNLPTPHRTKKLATKPYQPRNTPQSSSETD